MNSTFLTGREIADILKISKALAYRLIANGEISSVRFGRTVRVKQEDLDEFISKNTARVHTTELYISDAKGDIKDVSH